MSAEPLDPSVPAPTVDAAPADVPSDVAATLRGIAADRFGWTTLRPGQAEAAGALAAGRDALVVMPTGHGKSAVYQLAGLALPRATVVVSPLIALQHDQVVSLAGTGVDDAVAVNSRLSVAERDDAWARAADGSARFVFLSPEQLARDDVLERLQFLRPSLLVVDEAHCVSQWGHDFRPDYLRVGEAVEALGRPTVAALTATASPPVRDDVVDRLRMRDPLVLVEGFDRPNLWLEVTRTASDDDKREQVLLRAATSAKPGLVYTATRRDAERYAGELAGLGLSAAAYHAGLRETERTRVHEEFLAGDLDVVVATSAFGMGIDKADVRFVVHASVTDSLDSYYQEAGRAGRDGEPALAALWYRPEDLGLQRFLGGGAADEDVVRAVANRVHRAAPGRLTRSTLHEKVPGSRTKVTTAVNLLEQVGAVRSSPKGLVWVEGVAKGGAVTAALEADATRRRVARTRLDMVRAYAETTGCRRQVLLGYFGETPDGPCGGCDTCRDGSAREQAERAAEVDLDDVPGLQPGQRVEHREWGRGTVVQVEADRVTVLLEDEGYRTLALGALAGTDLLRVVG